MKGYVGKGLVLALSTSLIVGSLGSPWGIGKELSFGKKVVAQEKSTDLIIDGTTIGTESQDAYRGLGTVTCNNSSRLLLDYKEKNPCKYWEIMNWLFSPENGAGLSHIKIELGSDSDTSSGAEPATKRSSQEVANVNRGAGYLFAHDALTINPDITVDLLSWGMPGWVKDAYSINEKTGYKARYKWYKETIDEAYDVWGISLAYISANRNERGIEKDWTIYLSNALKGETDQRYDYGNIKIVAADESDTMKVATTMLKDENYRNAVDVIGCHYNSYMDASVLSLNKKYGKEIWYSEGASVATDSIFGYNNTETGVSTSGTQSMLDIANRIIIGFAQSKMTMYEFQPSVASYYDGSVYYPKQLIQANDPWSGYYQLSNGLAMAMQFNSFIKKGWQYIDSGSYGDGTQSQHYIAQTKNDYLTAADPATGNYSTVITNDSKSPRTYQVKVCNLASASSNVNVWETRSNHRGEDFDAGWLYLKSQITPTQSGDAYTYSVTVDPYTMITLTTTTGQKSYAARKAGTSANETNLDTSLSLPYQDDFQYTQEFLKRRGGTPLYTTDLNGAFEVVEDKGNNVLMEKIDQDQLPTGWGGLVDPITSLGDDTWKDYKVSVDAKLDPDTKNKSNYVSLIARYNCSPGISENGYKLSVYTTGKWVLSGNQGTLGKGTIKGVGPGKWMTLEVQVVENKVTAWVDGVKLIETIVTQSMTNSGRVGLGSGYYNNCYDNLQVVPVQGGINYVSSVDDLSDQITFTSDGVRLQGQGYTNYERTLSRISKKGGSFTYSFTGTSVALIGSNAAGPKINITIDGRVVESSFAVKDSNNRSAFYEISGLTSGQHVMVVTLVNSGGVDLDRIEVGKDTFVSGDAKATQITFGATKAGIGVGESLDLLPCLVGSSGNEKVSYTSSNPDVAIATLDGKIQGNGGGTAVITGTTQNGFTATYTIVVTEMKISPNTDIKVGAGESVTLATSFVQGINQSNISSWTSSDETLASVSDNGRVTTKAAGKVRITAHSDNGYTAQVEINIKTPPTKLIQEETSISLKLGKTKTLEYEFSPGSYSKNTTYTSNNKKIAVVSGTGKVTGKKLGTTTVTVKTYNGKTAKFKVTVKK